MKKKAGIWKKIFIIGGILLVVGVGVAWYIFTEKHEDTAVTKADYTTKAIDLINEFKTNDSAANKKYAEKIMVVSGTVTEVEQADTTVNIKMADTTNGSYVIFAFQQQNLAEAKTIKEGSIVAIKGSCSGGTYSDILEAEYVTFKRCIINKP